VPSTPVTTTNPDAKLFRLVGAVLAVLVLVQAALAGQFLTAGGGTKGVHRILGEFLGVVAVALAAQGYRIRRVSPVGWRLSLFVLALVVAQTGLGFAGRDIAAAAALHVPVGVLTFGAALITATPLQHRADQSE